MKSAIPILLLGLLPACSTRSTVHAAFPALPPLPAALSSSCPPLPLLPDPTLGTLAMADKDAATAYARCQAKHAGVVAAYDEARERLARAKSEKGGK